MRRTLVLISALVAQAFGVPARAQEAPVVVEAEVVVVTGAWGRTIYARVIHKARVWIEVEPPIESYSKNYRFRTDSQTDSESDYYCHRFLTPEQHKWDQAQLSAWEFIKSLKIRVDSSSPWTNRHIELARILWESQPSSDN